ncbi:PASTA domain-containing protein [bacterium]|nr:PASTA domain-containing protein [bacterium]
MSRNTDRSPKAPMGAPIQSARLLLVFAVLVLLAAATVFRLVSIQVVQHADYRDRANQQYTDTRELPPDRGVILDRRGRALVENLENYGSIGVRPSKVVDKSMTAQRLADALSLRTRDVSNRLKGDAPFVWVARQVPPDVANRVDGMDLPGVEVVRETKRSYPYGRTAGQVLGHVNVDNRGAAGVEQLREDVLAGRPGWEVVQMDAHGRPRYDNMFPREEPVHGGRVTLAIDIDAQTIAEEELAFGIEENEAVSGMVVITRPMTGEILAIASWPNYDPNDPGASPFEAQKNRSITDVYEPGSTFKIVPYSAIIERDLIDLEKIIDLEEGRWRVADRVIRDSHRYDSLTVRQGFAKSSNILTGKLAENLSKAEFYTVMRDFGFGQETGIDFIGEVGGILPETRHWSGVSQANMAIGQGVAVTPLQLAMAYGAIANNGWLLRPLLITSEVSPDGEVVRNSPVRVRRVIQPSTARIMRKLMVEAVEDGTGGQAMIAGISVAGKTGTAQKPDPENRGYMPGRYVSSFCGFLPAENPEWLALVVIDDPQGRRYYGGSVAGPVFRRIMERLLVTLPYNEIRYAREDYENPRELPVRNVLAPAVLALTADEAVDVLRHAGLEARIEGDGDVVIAQKQPVGTLLHAGDSVELTLGCAAMGDTLCVPELREKSLRAALAELTRCGLQPQVTGSGIVVGQNPGPGVEVPAGTRVTLVAQPYLGAVR